MGHAPPHPGSQPSLPVPASSETDADVALTILEPLCAVFRRKLRSEGLKYTPERAQVLDTVIRLGGPFDAERVLEDVHSAGFAVSKATMYRTLKLLMDAGIVQRVMVTPEQSYYQCSYAQAGTRDQTALLVVRDPSPSTSAQGATQFEALNVPEVRALCQRLCSARGLTLDGIQLHIFARR